MIVFIAAYKYAFVDSGEVQVGMSPSDNRSVVCVNKSKSFSMFSNFNNCCFYTVMCILTANLTAFSYRYTCKIEGHNDVEF